MPSAVLRFVKVPTVPADGQIPSMFVHIEILRLRIPSSTLILCRPYTERVVFSLYVKHCTFELSEILLVFKQTPPIKFIRVDVKGAVGQIFNGKFV